ncbi:hypothetical protein BD413DRAFT_194138 [Trametes elegans]|nr:hypothetical protein BD413DRAFT_194138 [Trametes elegans]
MAGELPRAASTASRMHGVGELGRVVCAQGRPRHVRDALRAYVRARAHASPRHRTTVARPLEAARAGRCAYPQHRPASRAFVTSRSGNVRSRPGIAVPTPTRCGGRKGAVARRQRDRAEELQLVLGAGWQAGRSQERVVGSSVFLAGKSENVAQQSLAQIHQAETRGATSLVHIL